ncbi:MAG: DUF4286 family protein [Acidobacteriota bacterium]|nr:DUF4286 family protein [Acidobacteriota bacterium]MDH3528582.1 DUF4286 family protein [Acidobacteriota bacterium]
MVIYEITATVENRLRDQFEQYMSDIHVPDVLATGYFETADMAEDKDSEFVIQYSCESRLKLDEYLATCADDLRKDFAMKFPEGVEIKRRIYEPE